MADPEVVDEGKGKSKGRPSGKEAGGDEEAKVKKAGSAPDLGMLPVLIAALVGIFLAVGGAFFLVKSLTPKEPVAEAPAESEAPKKEAKGKKPPAKKANHGSEGGSGAEGGAQGTLYTFDKPVIVNLAETNAERYFKVNLVLEMDNEELGAELDERKPQIMDLLINILSNKTLDNISTTSGRNMLRQEMIDKINALLETGRLVNIYFTEFVVQ